MSKKKRKAPREKKDESYKYDRRNSYGENDKSSRKAIRKNKAITRRQARRTAKQQIVLQDGEVDIVPKLGKEPFEKFPDRPLGEFLEHQTEKREKLFGRKERVRKENEKLKIEESNRQKEEQEKLNEQKKMLAKEQNKQRFLKKQKGRIREAKK